MSSLPATRALGSQLGTGSALLRCVQAALGAAGCAGLMIAAVLIPAPPAVLPLLIPVAIGLPMATALNLRPAVSALRQRSRAGQALSALRRDLQRLPETEHPLGR
jgi:hypothetical protein